MATFFLKSNLQITSGSIMKNAKSLTILQMNDTHGYIEEHWEQSRNGHELVHFKAGGYARIHSYVSKVRKEKDEAVLFLDGGDTFHGTYSVVLSKGVNLIPMLNLMKPDAMTAHWEFAYGPGHFKKITEQLSYPMLAINCYEKESKELVFPPYLIKKVNGIKVGIVGIASTIIDKVMPEKFSEGIYFTMGNKELPGYIHELKHIQKVDLIVVLSHLGFPQDVKLAEETEGIDILLSAHTHNRMFEPANVNGAIIMQSGCHGSFIGQLDLEITEQKISSWSHRLVTMDESIPPDPEMGKMVKKAMHSHRKYLDEIIGNTATSLDRYQSLECTMDNFLLEAILEKTGAEVAFSNGWRYGAPIPEGPVTMNDLWNIIPVNAPVSTITMTGKEIRDMLEENLEHTFAANPYDQMGGYVKRCLGLNFYVKIENPFGQRIQSIFIKDKPCETEREYQVVFVTSQGVPLKYGTQRTETENKAIEVLVSYLKKHKTIKVPLRGTVIAV